MNGKTLLLFFSLFGNISAYAADPSNYYCREAPLGPGLIFKVGQKTCTDASGTKSVSTGAVCQISTLCYFLSPELKAAILGINLSQVTSETVVTADQARGKIETAIQMEGTVDPVTGRAPPLIQLVHDHGEVSELMCDAVPNDDLLDTQHPFHCKVPKKCLGDRFMEMDVLPPGRNFNQADNNRLLDASGPMIYEAAPKAIAVDPNQPETP